MGISTMASALCFTRTPKSPRSPVRLRKHGYFRPLDLLVFRNDHLGDALAGFHGLRLVGEVDEDDFDFAPVVGVNGAGGVDEAEALLDG